ncbi:MAG: cobalt-precorrin 5A hydrolase [Deltaproteobacteria bacterium]|jgi:cobalt-precorrin 5A hydrolase|nr:cobalt-precorrin 5A hydrolase [Deltaproteobacteria bacterium]MBT4527606.1 cobalt-precorrin 5A hydrolase [Deltaproteobacteria bacterium]
MKIACFYFSDSGEQLAGQLKSKLGYQIELFSKSNYKQQMAAAFQSCEALIFVSATGVAVRLIAPYLQSKLKDPAVVVIDDTGQFVISLVSGHIGGANALTQEISELINATPIITTASDNRGFEALDLFAQRHHLIVENSSDMKNIMTMMVNGETIGFFADNKYQLNYPHINNQNYKGAVYISEDSNISSQLPYCVLRPKNINIGIGCRRGKSKQEILVAVKNVFKSHQLSLVSINKMASIEAKSDEIGIIETAAEIKAELHFFSEVQIKAIQENYTSSNFVEQSVGVTSVCEPCAELCGGTLILKKQVHSGITIALSKEK